MMSLLRRRMMMATLGGEEEMKAFEHIGTVDLSTMQDANALSEIFALKQAKEIVLVWTDMENSTTSSSTIRVYINGEYYSLASTGKSGNPMNGYTHIQLLENVGTKVEEGAGAISTSNHATNISAVKGVYNLIPITVPYETIQIGQPATQYSAIAGTVEIYAR